MKLWKVRDGLDNAIRVHCEHVHTVYSAVLCCAAVNPKRKCCGVTSLCNDCFDSQENCFLHRILLTQGYDCSQNAVNGFQLHCPYVKNVFTLSDSTKEVTVFNRPTRHVLVV